MWNIKIIESAVKELKQLSPEISKRIYKTIQSKIAIQDNPCAFSEALQHDLYGLWRLRVGDYRIIFRVLPKEKTIQITKVGHRKNIYL